MFNKNEHNGVMTNASNRGNIFFTLFAVVAVVGGIGVGVSNLIQGPVSTMVKNNQIIATEDRSELNLKLMMNNLLGAAPDCDADGTIEAMSWRTPTGVPLPPSPTGGGLFPNTVTPRTKDAWGTEFGYCTWDYGTIRRNGTCADDARRLTGSTAFNQPFVALVSAGPDKKFNTSCADYVDTTPADGVPDNKMLNKLSGSDDIIFSYTYAEAAEAMGDNWLFTKDAGSTGDTLKTSQNLQFSQDLSFGGVLDMKTLGAGLTLSDKAGAVCNSDTEGHLFTDSTIDPPSLAMCKAGTFVPVGAGGTAPAGTADSDFDPTKYNCAATNQGPFVLAGTSGAVDARTFRGNAGRLLNAIPGTGTRVNNFNGTTFTTTTTYTGMTGALPIWDDGTYIYVGNTSPRTIQALTLSGTTWTLRGSYTHPAGTPDAIWGDGKYIYLAAQGAGLTALSFDGTNFTSLATYASTDARDVWSDGTYVYLADNTGGVRVLSFDGTAFTLLATAPTTGGALYVYGDGTYIYAALGAEGVRAYSFTGSALTPLATYSAPIGSVFSDGVNVYAGATDGTLYALNFDGTSFKVLNSIAVGAAVAHIWGDGAYVFTGTTSNIKAYKGFECTDAGPPQPATQAVNPNLDLNYRAFAWGRNTNGQLGNGTNTGPVTAPASLLNSAGFIGVSGDQQAGCGLRSDGVGFCWGTDTNGILGNGPIITSSQYTPVQILDITDWVKIEVGDYTACGIRKNGDVYCWGEDRNGSLGNGPSVASAHTPVKVSNLTDAVDISVGLDSACAVRKNGEAWCWGSNATGNLGDGTSTNSDVPVKVVDVSDFIQISTADDAVCAVTRSGAAYCWGEDATLAQLGNGPGTAVQLRPNRVLDISDFIKVVVSNQACGLRKSGQIWCWGLDNVGQIGNGSVITATQDAPSPVSDIIDFVDFATATGGSACGITSIGEIWCWGADSYGELGNGATAGNKDVPFLANALPGGYIPHSIFNTQNGYYAIGRKVLEGGEPAPSGNIRIRQPRSTAGASSLESYGLTITSANNSANHEAGFGFAVDATSTAGTDGLSGAIVAYRATGGSLYGGLRLKVSDGSTLKNGLRIFEHASVQLYPPTITGGVHAAFTVGAPASWNDAEFWTGLLLTGTYPNFIGTQNSTGRGALTFDNTLVIKKMLDDTGTSLEDAFSINTADAVFNYNYALASVNEDTDFTSGTWSDTATDFAAGLFYKARSGGPFVAQTSVNNGDILGNLIFSGDSNVNGSASIFSRVVGAPSSGNTPASLVFRTSPTALTTTATERMTLMPTGQVIIGDSTTPNTTLKLQVEKRITADNGVKVGMDASCSSAANEEGTIRYNAGTWEYCNGTTWLPWSGGGGGTCTGLKPVQVAANANVIYVVLSDGSVISKERTTAAADNYPTYEYGFRETANVHTRNGKRIPNLAGVMSVKTRLGYVPPNGDQVGVTYAIQKNGNQQSVVLWGSDGPAEISSTRSYSQIDTRFGAEDAGSVQCAVTIEGQVDCWGGGDDGTDDFYPMLGMGAVPTGSTGNPEASMAFASVKVALGFKFSCALRKNGKVSCWGFNANGQLGRGTTGAVQYEPLDISTLSNVRDIASRQSATCAVLDNGQVWCWGLNAANGIIASAAGNYPTPTQVSGITNAVAISPANSLTMCALLSNGTVKCWGGNANGHTGALITTTSPVASLAVTGSTGVSDNMLAITQDGNVVSWAVDAGFTGVASTVALDIGCAGRKHVFRTKQSFTGDLGGVKGADAICNTAASLAKLPGHYKAWLSDGISSPSTRFSKVTGLYSQNASSTTSSTSGIAAGGWADLVDGSSLTNPIAYDEYGDARTLDHWSGTGENGDSTILGTATTRNCRGWTFGSAGESGVVGSSTTSSTTWGDQTTAVCNTLKTLICFQQD